MKILIGLLVGVMSILVLSALTAPMNELMSANRGSDVFNCNGYVDASNAVLSYNSSLESNTFGCSITSFGIPLFILAVVIIIIMFTMYGEPTQRETDLMYQQAY